MIHHALEIRDQAGVRRRLVSTPILKLGKLPSCTVWFDGPDVPRMHAVMERIGDRWTIIDLGSTAGTVVNGVRVNKTELQDGDVLELGSVRIRFAHLDAPPAFGSVEAEAFRARVLARPESDDERLVFADWLVERGDPVGELIQAQIALASGRSELAAHVEALAARVEAFVVGDPPVGVLAWTVRRGFVERLRVGNLVERATYESFVQRHPIVDVVRHV